MPLIVGTGTSDCATIKHAVANELDEPLRNLFQWASFASHCLRPELLNTVP